MEPAVSEPIAKGTMPVMENKFLVEAMHVPYSFCQVSS